MDDRETAHYGLDQLFSFEAPAEWEREPRRDPLDPITLSLGEGVVVEVAAVPGDESVPPLDLLKRWVELPIQGTRTFSVRGIPAAEVAVTLRNRATVLVLLKPPGSAALITFRGPVAALARRRPALDELIASVRFPVDLGADFTRRVLAAFAVRWPALRFRALACDNIEAIDPRQPNRAWHFGLAGLARRVVAAPSREAELIAEHAKGLGLDVKLVPSSEPRTPVRATVRPQVVSKRDAATARG